MDSREITPSRIPPELTDYVRLLSTLRAYHTELGLTDMPDEPVRVTFPTGEAERPIGALLPTYSQERSGTDAEGMKCVLFNLRALTGFVPPTRRG